MKAGIRLSRKRLVQLTLEFYSEFEVDPLKVPFTSFMAWLEWRKSKRA